MRGRPQEGRFSARPCRWRGSQTLSPGALALERSRQMSRARDKVRARARQRLAPSRLARAARDRNASRRAQAAGEAPRRRRQARGEPARAGSGVARSARGPGGKFARGRPRAHWRGPPAVGALLGAPETLARFPDVVATRAVYALALEQSRQLSGARAKIRARVRQKLAPSRLAPAARDRNASRRAQAAGEVSRRCRRARSLYSCAGADSAA